MKVFISIGGVPGNNFWGASTAIVPTVNENIEIFANHALPIDLKKQVVTVQNVNRNPQKFI